MRVTNWPKELDKIIIAASRTPFEWGKHDCCLFAADCIKAITGTDPAVDFRGKYADEDGATEVLFYYAGGQLPEAADKIARAFGYEEINPRLAQRGDVALCSLPTGETMGVVSLNGRDVLVAAQFGLLSVPLKQAIKAWKVE